MNQNEGRELGKRYKKGQTIYQQGDQANCCYIVQQGRISIDRRTSKGKKCLAEIGKGEIFGVISLFIADHSRYSTAHALEESRVLQIGEKFFIARLHRDPSLSFRIIRHIAQRVYDLDHEVSESQEGVEGKTKNKKKKSGKGSGKSLSSKERGSAVSLRKTCTKR